MQTTTTSVQPGLLSAEVARDPDSFYRRLRSESPLHVDSDTGWFLLSRHADVGAAYRNPAFSTRNYEISLEPVFGRSLLQMDGHEHARKRALVTPYFRGQGLAHWAPVIMRNAVDILGGAVTRQTEQLAATFERGSTVDLLQDFGYYLPVFVIADMLGLPKTDHARFFSWYTAHVDFLANFSRDAVIDQRGLDATAELRAYLTPIIVSRRHEPREDLISALCTAEVDGEVLTDDEIMTHVTQLLNAGSETTGKTLANLFGHLLEQPELFESVQDDRSLVVKAISETLRFTPPSQMNGRFTTEDVEIAGGVVPTGSTVMLLIASANRDERRFSHPDVFDMHRPDLNHDRVFTATGEHFAFGFGRHFCLGAMLAKMELEHSISLLLDRFPHMMLADGFVPRRSGLKMRSVESMRVVL